MTTTTLPAAATTRPPRATGHDPAGAATPRPDAPPPPAAAGWRTLVRGRADDPAWARPALLVLLLGHRAAVPVGPVRVGLRQQLLRRRRAGRLAELEGLVLRLAGLGQLDHRRQAAGRRCG